MMSGDDGNCRRTKGSFMENVEVCEDDAMKFERKKLMVDLHFRRCFSYGEVCWRKGKGW